MIRWALTRLVRWLPPPRIIRGSDGSKYLSRYYLTGAPAMPDGSSPFDAFGEPYPEATWSGRIGIYLHRFHQGDEAREPHSHPFSWMFSLILAGGYREERRYGKHTVRRDLKPGDMNLLYADDFHRVDLLDGECWTLFIVGPKVKGWGFLESDGTVTPWREYIAGKRTDAQLDDAIEDLIQRRDDADEILRSVVG